VRREPWPEPADGVVRLDDLATAGRRWLLTDLLDAATYERSGDDLVEHGLYVARPGWAVHVFQVEPDTAAAASSAGKDGFDA
jgi:hypothetical protein